RIEQARPVLAGPVGIVTALLQGVGFRRLLIGSPERSEYPSPGMDGRGLRSRAREIVDDILSPAPFRTKRGNLNRVEQTVIAHAAHAAANPTAVRWDLAHRVVNGNQNARTAVPNLAAFKCTLLRR